jgi:hypothetical protein
MTDRTSDADISTVLQGDPLDVVREVWADALGMDAVDPDAGFFDLGATSALTLDVVRILRERWPHLKVVHIFSHPTVAQLAAFLDES